MFLGQYNKLTINRFAPPGAYLVNDEDDEILLPNKYVKEDFEIGDELEVFVYKDHEERLVAVTDKPLIELYGFAYLRCTDVNHNGAFVDWGMEKQLMIPYAEQITKMEEENTTLFTSELTMQHSVYTEVRKFKNIWITTIFSLKMDKKLIC